MLKRTLTFLAIATVTLALITGCATTPRQPPSFATLGNFEQFQLNQAIFRVKFTGDSSMSQGIAEEIALLKSAKTTLDAGYRYFHVLNESKDPPVRRAVVYPDPWFNPYPHRFSRWPYYGSGYGGWGWPNDPFYGTTVYNVDPVEVSYTIKCSNAMSAQNDEFDAQLIMRSLGPKYFLNPDGSARVIAPSPGRTP